MFGNKRTFYILACIVFIGILLRIKYRCDILYWGRDEIVYLSWVEKIASDSLDTEIRAYKLLIYLGLFFKKLNLDVETGLRCFNNICSVAWIIVMFYLGKEIANKRTVGLLCALFASCNPYITRLSNQIMRDPLALLLTSVVLLLIIQAMKKDLFMIYSIIISPIIVLAIWNRDESFELIALTFLALFINSFLTIQDKTVFRMKHFISNSFVLMIGLIICGSMLYVICPKVFDAFSSNIRMFYLLFEEKLNII